MLLLLLLLLLGLLQEALATPVEAESLLPHCRCWYWS